MFLSHNGKLRANFLSAARDSHMVFQLQVDVTSDDEIAAAKEFLDDSVEVIRTSLMHRANAEKVAEHRRRKRTVGLRGVRSTGWPEKAVETGGEWSDGESMADVPRPLAIAKGGLG